MGSFASYSRVLNVSERLCDGGDGGDGGDLGVCVQPAASSSCSRSVSEVLC